jgi:hypothetical protein
MTAAPLPLPLPQARGESLRRIPAADTDATHLRRLRWAVRAVLAVAARIAANVLHARANLISRLIAGWPPLAVPLTVELIPRMPADRRGLAAARLIAAAVIAGIAAWVSFRQMVGVAALRSLRPGRWFEPGFRVVDRSVPGRAGRCARRLGARLASA